MEKFIHLNIVLMPLKEVSEAAISLSKKLGKKYKTEFILDGIKFHPHITLYSLEYPEKNIDKIFDTVEKIAKQTPKIKLVVKSIQPFNFKSKGDECVVTNFLVTPEIRKLHEQIIKKLNPLRHGRIPDKYQDKNKLNSLPQKQKENMLKYGVRRCMNLYNPHLTISTIEDENQLKKAISETKLKIKKFTVGKIGIYKMGENGTCRILLKEFSL